MFTKLEEKKKMNRASWQIFLLVRRVQKNYRKAKAQILCFKEHMEKIQKKKIHFLPDMSKIKTI